MHARSARRGHAGGLAVVGPYTRRRVVTPLLGLAKAVAPCFDDGQVLNDLADTDAR